MRAIRELFSRSNILESPILVRLWQHVKSPDFSNQEELSRAAAFVNNLDLMIILVMIVSGLCLIPLFAIDKWLSWAIVVSILGVAGLSRFFLFQGRLALARNMIVYTTWLIFQGIALFSGGVTSPIAIAISAATIIAAMLLEFRQALIMVILSCLASFTAVLLQIFNITLPVTFVFSPISAWLWYSLSLIFVFASIALIIHNLNNALSAAQKQSEARLQAEATLRQSEERLRQAINLAGMGVWNWDLVTDQVEFTNEMFKIYGIAPGDFTGRGADYLNFTHPDDAHIQRENIRRDVENASLYVQNNHLTSDARPDPKEYRIIRTDGAVRWVRGDAVEIVDSNGKITAMHGILWDITDSKIATINLQESELRFRSLIEHAPMAIILSRSGACLYANPRFVEIFGWADAKELEGYPVFQFFAPEYQAASLERAERCKQGLAESNEFLAMAIRKSGESFPILVSLSEVKLSDGDVVLSFITDISERLRTENMLRESQSTLNAIMDSTNDLIWSVEPQNYGLLTFNQSLVNYFQKKRGVTIHAGMRPEDLFPDPEYIHKWQNYYLQALNTGPFSVEYRTFSGSNVLQLSFNLLARKGVVFGISVFGKDITDIKLHEAELEAIASLSAALRSAPDRASMLPVLVEKLSQVLNCLSVSVEIIDPDTQEAVVEAAHGAWLPMLGSRQPPGTGLNEVIRKTRQPYFSNNIGVDTRRSQAFYHPENIRSGAGVPLIAQDELIGYLWMGRSDDIQDIDLRLLTAIADMAANAIHRTTLHERTQQNALDLARAYESTLEGWARALELRDHETEGHSNRVTDMTVRLARRFGIPDGELLQIRRGALLHDIGKMGIPDMILHKPGPLTSEEWEIMRRHPEYAYNLLYDIEHLRPALDIPYCHHEKWDGSGYPRSLRGEEIPLAARLFAVVDVWDALRTNRPYRPAWPVDKARAYIISQAGAHFDPRIVPVFLDELDHQPVELI